MKRMCDVGNIRAKLFIYAPSLSLLEVTLATSLRGVLTVGYNLQYISKNPTVFGLSKSVPLAGWCIKLQQAVENLR